jgi:hypothetical protein
MAEPAALAVLRELLYLFKHRVVQPLQAECPDLPVQVQAAAMAAVRPVGIMAAALVDTQGMAETLLLVPLPLAAAAAALGARGRIMVAAA